MVIVLIFLIHIVFTIYIVVKRIKTESKSTALFDVVLIIILFSVGWSLSTMISKVFWDPEGFGKHFDRDTISLTILTIVEFFFYKFYYNDLISTGGEREK